MQTAVLNVKRVGICAPQPDCVRLNRSNKLPQHRAQPPDAFADVRLAGAAEADAHFVIRFATCRIVGVTEFTGNIEHVVFQRGLKQLWISRRWKPSSAGAPRNKVRRPIPKFPRWPGNVPPSPASSRAPCGRNAFAVARRVGRKRPVASARAKSCCSKFAVPKSWLPLMRFDAVNSGSGRMPKPTRAPVANGLV